MPIRIVLADDHVLVRQGLKSLLEREKFQVMAEASDGQDAVRLTETHHPDITVLDISMPTLNGIDAAKSGSMEDIIKGVWPFMIAQLVVLFLMVLFPATVTVPAKWFGG